jgi:hypothetical protein
MEPALLNNQKRDYSIKECAIQSICLLYEEIVYIPVTALLGVDATDTGTRECRSTCPPKWRRA